MNKLILPVFPLMAVPNYFNAQNTGINTPFPYLIVNTISSFEYETQKSIPKTMVCKKNAQPILSLDLKRLPLSN